MENLKGFIQAKDSDLKKIHWELYHVIGKLQEQGFTPELAEQLNNMVGTLEEIQGDLSVISQHMEMDMPGLEDMLLENTMEHVTTK